MDLTYEQARELIHTPKIILESEGKACAQKTMDLCMGFVDNVLLKSEDEEFLFKWTIRQSTKELCKLSLNVIEKESLVGLFRVDYVPHDVRHQNPVNVNERVPEELVPYAGAEIYGAHAHFHVPGYRSLIWACPLVNMEYGTKGVELEHGRVDIFPAILSFANYIAVKTPIVAQTCVL